MKPETVFGGGFGISFDAFDSAGTADCSGKTGPVPQEVDSVYHFLLNE